MQPIDKKMVSDTNWFKIFAMKDDKLARIVLLVFCILTPIGSVYILFSHEFTELTIFSFLFFTFGFSPLFIVLTLVYHFLEHSRDEYFLEKFRHTLVTTKRREKNIQNILDQLIGISKIFGPFRKSVIEKLKDSRKTVKSTIKELKNVIQKVEKTIKELEKRKKEYLFSVLLETLMGYIAVFILLSSFKELDYFKYFGQNTISSKEFMLISLVTFFLLTFVIYLCKSVNQYLIDCRLTKINERATIIFEGCKIIRSLVKKGEKLDKKYEKLLKSKNKKIRKKAQKEYKEENRKLIEWGEEKFAKIEPKRIFFKIFKKYNFI